jgi:hypothetical protein
LLQAAEVSMVRDDQENKMIGRMAIAHKKKVWVQYLPT